MNFVPVSPLPLMIPFPLPRPPIDEHTLGAVNALAAREGKSIEHYATYGFDDASALGCDPLAARLACCWRAVESAPTNGLALLELGHCYRAEIGDSHAAEAVYHAVEHGGRPGLRTGVHDEDPLFFLAWLCADADRLGEALDLYDRVVARLTPDNEGHALLHYHIASVYHDAEMWVEAVEEYELAAGAVRWSNGALPPGTDGSPPLPSGGSGASPVVCYEDAFQRFFGLESLREVTAQRWRALGCLPFAGSRGCRITGGSGLYTPPLGS